MECLMAQDIKIYPYSKKAFPDEFYSAIADYHANFGQIPMISRKQNTGKAYINIPLSIDFETSSFIDDQGRENCLVYIWQFGIYNHVFYGRNIDDLRDIFNSALTDVVRAFYKNNCDEYSNSKKYRIVVYAHNLSYEFSFCHRLLNINRKTEIIATSARDIIRFELEKQKNITIEFRCSYRLSGLSLRDLTKQFTRKIVKQPAINYELWRAPETELSDTELLYSVYDVYCVNEYIHEKFESGELLADIPPTKTSYVRQDLKREVKISLLESDHYQKYMNRTKIPNLKSYIYLHKIFKGGFTHSSIYTSFMIHDRVKHLDITSSYPTVLLSEKYPVTSFFPMIQKGVKGLELSDSFYKQTGSKYENETINSFLDYDLEHLRNLGIAYFVVFIADVERKLECPDSMIATYDVLNSKFTQTEIPEITSKFQGKISDGKNLMLIMTDVDYCILKKTHNISNFRLINMFYAYCDFLPVEMVSTILDYYENKTKYKDDDPILYALYKGNLNSLYGMCVTSPLQENFTYNGEKLSSEYEGKSDSEIEQLQIQHLMKYNKPIDRGGHFTAYTTGIWVAAYGRNNLFSAILECGIDYLYADTDSIFCTNYEKHKKYFEDYNIAIQKKLRNNPVIKQNEELLKSLNCTDKNGVHYPLGIWDSETLKPSKDDIKFYPLKLWQYIKLSDSEKETYNNLSPEQLKQNKQELNKLLKNGNYHFISLGPKRYMQIVTDEDDNIIKIKLTFAGYNPDHLLIEMFRQNDYDPNKVIDCFHDMGKKGKTFIIDKEHSTKTTNKYIDFESDGIITDYKGNKYKFHSYGGTYLTKVPFTINIADNEIETAIEAIADNIYRMKSQGFNHG